MCFDDALSDSRLRRDVIHTIHVAAAAACVGPAVILEARPHVSTAHTNARLLGVSGDVLQFNLTAGF